MLRNVYNTLIFDELNAGYVTIGIVKCSKAVNQCSTSVKIGTVFVVYTYNGFGV